MNQNQYKSTENRAISLPKVSKDYLTLGTTSKAKNDSANQFKPDKTESEPIVKSRIEHSRGDVDGMRDGYS